MGRRRFPYDAMNEGELLVEDTRPHWRVVVLPMMHTAAFGLLVLWILFTLADGYWGRVLLALVLFAGLAPWGYFSLRAMLVWYSTRYAFTDRRVLVCTGFVNAVETEIPLAQIENPTVERTWWERLFRFSSGDLTLSNAKTLRHVPDAQKLKRLVTGLTAEQGLEPGATLTWIVNNFPRVRKATQQGVPGGGRQASPQGQPALRPSPPRPDGGDTDTLLVTALYGGQVEPGHTYPFLVLLHRRSAAAQAQQLVARHTSHLGSAPVVTPIEANGPVAPGTMVTISPNVLGVGFEPEHIEMFLTKPVHEVAFRLTVAVESPDPTGDGWVDIRTGTFIVGQIPVLITARSAATSG